MPNWGVTYETLRDARSDIIFASLSGYGATGPYTNFPATGATIARRRPDTRLNNVDLPTLGRPTSTTRVPVLVPSCIALRLDSRKSPYLC